MTLVKICGVRHPEHALVAAEAGADYIGMIFAPSRRQITVEQAAAIVAAVKSGMKAPPKLVGVFVNAPAEQVNEAAEKAGLDMVQLSGNEDEDYLEEVRFPRIKAVHVDPKLPGAVGWMTLRRRMSSLKALDVLPLLDAQVDGQFGGTGQAFDWATAKSGASDFDYMLAGGLTALNVGEAIAHLHPWAVDVSSGVETTGVKDEAKIRSFIQAVRKAG